MDMGDGGCVEYILYVIYSYIICNIFIYYKRGGVGWGKAIPEPAPNPSRVLKKISKPVPNPFIKIDPCPIRDGVGRVPQKTRPIAIPSCTRGKSLSICHISYIKFSQSPNYTLFISFIPHPLYFYIYIRVMSSKFFFIQSKILSL